MSKKKQKAATEAATDSVKKELESKWGRQIKENKELRQFLNALVSNQIKT